MKTKMNMKELNLNEMALAAAAGCMPGEETQISHILKFTDAVKYYGNEILRAGATVYMYGHLVKTVIWNKVTSWFD